MMATKDERKRIDVSIQLLICLPMLKLWGNSIVNSFQRQMVRYCGFVESGFLDIGMYILLYYIDKVF